MGTNWRTSKCRASQPSNCSRKTPTRLKTTRVTEPWRDLLLSWTLWRNLRSLNLRRRRKPARTSCRNFPSGQNFCYIFKDSDLVFVLVLASVCAWKGCICGNVRQKCGNVRQEEEILGHGGGYCSRSPLNCVLQTVEPEIC